MIVHIARSVMNKPNNNNIRIDAVAIGDFRTCDKTQARVFHKLLRRMGPEDVLALISMHGDQLRFMKNPVYFEDGLLEGSIGMAHGIQRVLGQQTYRSLDGGKWTPIHIRNLCSRLGFTLVNYEALVKHFGYDTNYGRGGMENDIPPPPSPKGKHTRTMRAGEN